MGDWTCSVINNLDKVSVATAPWVPEANVQPLYGILARWKCRPGVRATRDHRINRRLIRDLKEAGFIVRSQSLCFWASDYDGWLVFEGWDLQAYQNVLLDLRSKHELDRWRELDFTIGSVKDPPFFRITASPEDPKNRCTITAELLEIRESNGTCDFARLSDDGKEHSINFVLVGERDEGVDISPSGGTVVMDENDHPDRYGRRTYTTTSAEAVLTSAEAGEVKVFVGIDDPGRGGVISVKFK